jgi:hypothetical protein
VLLGTLGLATLAISVLNKLFRILPFLLPNLATYGLVLCVLAAIIGLFAVLSIQLRFLYQAVVHVQSQLLGLSRSDGVDFRAGCNRSKQ